MSINAPAASSRAFSLLPGSQQLHGALEETASESSSSKTPAHQLERKVEQVRERLSPSQFFADCDGLLFNEGLLIVTSRSPAAIDQASGSDSPDQVMQAVSPPLGLLAEGPPEQPQTVPRRLLLCQRQPALQQEGEPAHPSQVHPLTIGNILLMQIMDAGAATWANREQAEKHLKSAECLWSAYSQAPSMEEYLESLPSNSMRDRYRNAQLRDLIKLLAAIDSWQAEVQRSSQPSQPPE